VQQESPQDAWMIDRVSGINTTWTKAGNTSSSDAKSFAATTSNIDPPTNTITTAVA
jgi:hypothetical protein